jgi:hypothetical protein
MKTIIEDKELKNVLKSIKLDSPGPNFSVRVMNRIFQENSILEKIKNERIFGKGFWIIIALFVLLFAAMFVFSGTENAAGGGIAEFIPKLNSNGVEEGYQSFFQKIGTVPLSVAGIMLASSILLFIERFINSKSKVLTK